MGCDKIKGIENMVELVTDRLVIATPGEKHIDEVFRIMSTRCLAERTGFKKMDDVSEAEGKIRWAMRTGSQSILSQTTDRQERWPWREDSGSESVQCASVETQVAATALQ